MAVAQPGEGGSFARPTAFQSVQPAASATAADILSATT